MNLLDVLVSKSGDGDVLRGVVATVTAVGSRVVTLSVLGGTVRDVPCAKAYAAPAVGDHVLVVKLGSAWVALSALG